jgi:hypothetical protein
MQIEGYVQSLREDLTRLAAIGDEGTARAAELLGVALESSLSRRLQEALSEAALELSAQLGERGRVEVRVSGGEPELVLVSEEAGPETPGDVTLDARITLRLPEALKGRIEEAASREGISANTWIVRALGREAGSSSHRGGGSRNRLSGYGRA